MDKNIAVLCCWECLKQYPTDIYPPFTQTNKLVKCSCGGQVVSNSGKIMLKILRKEENK